MDLTNLQRVFLADVQQQRLDEPFQTLPHIDHAAGLDAALRLAIYQNNYVNTLTHHLGVTYRVCRQLVGAAFFDGLTQRYLAHHVSRSFTLHDYGAQFADFIERDAFANVLPYLADMARLEWACHRATFSAEPLPFASAELESVPETQRESLVFFLPEGSTLLRSTFPLKKIWEAHAAESAEIPFIHLEQEQVSYLFVQSRELMLQLAELRENEWRLLLAIERGCTLAELCEQFAKAADGEDADIVTLLPKCIIRGWLGGFKTYAHS